MINPATIGIAAQQILDTVDAALVTAGLGDLARKYVSFGRVVDDCCEEGILGVHLDRTFATENFPTEAGATKLKCVYRTGAHFVVTVAKCWPTVAAGGSPPEPEVIQAAAMDLYAYWWVAWRTLLDGAVTGTLLDGTPCSVATGGPGEPALPSGGCARFTIRVTVLLTDDPNAS